MFFSRIRQHVQIHQTKKVIEDLNVIEKYFKVRQKVSVEILTSLSIIKDELQTPIENYISCNKRKKTLFWLNGYGLKQLLTMNPVGKQITKNNTTSENMKYLVDLR